jgi:hypothetical protein
MTPLVKSVTSYPVSIFIAGNYENAKATCQDYCDKTGFCVTVTKTTYVYTKGNEEGIVVGLINYPRFPLEPKQLIDRAIEIAEILRIDLKQESYSIQTPDKTIWYSYRKNDVVV